MVENYTQGWLTCRAPLLSTDNDAFPLSVVKNIRTHHPQLWVISNTRVRSRAKTLKGELVHLSNSIVVSSMKKLVKN
jgi:hypothetical protein